MPPQRKYRSDLIALIAYVVLAILLTYPLILHFTTHVAGDGSDDPALAWNLWWVPYSILQLGSSPIYTQHMFYPIGLNLAFYTLTYLNAFLSIPLQYAFNLVVAANVNLLLSFVLSGFGAYVLTKFLVRNSKFEIRNSKLEIRNTEPEAVGASRELGIANYEFRISNFEFAAFLSGALYAFSSNKLLYASLGQFNIASSQWIPFYVLFLLKLTTGKAQVRTRLFYGVMLGLFLLFQALAEFIFASFLIVATVVYVAAWLVVKRHVLRQRLSAIGGLAVGALVFVVPMMPILAAMLQDMRVEGDYIQSGLGFADVFSSDVLGFFIPGHLHPLFGGLEQQFHFAYTNFAYLGFIALALAAIALWKVPAARLWGIGGALFILITLGPALQVNGNATPLPFLPFNWLLDIPFVKGNRYPSRWSVMVTLCLAVMVGYGALWASTKLKAKSPRWGLIFAFSFLVLALFEHLSVPLPLSDFHIPDVYRTIAQDKGDFTVLEVPLAWRNGFRMTGPIDAEMMFEQWYQTEHHHPILGGNTSRNPELKFQYFTEAPVVNSLIAVETGHTLDAATLARDKQLAPQILSLLGVKYVVWHSPRDPANRAALDNARVYIEQVLPVTKFYDETDETGETVAYHVRQEEPAVRAVARASDAWARLNFAEGWGTVGSSAVWATRTNARLFVYQQAPAAPEGALTLRLMAPMAGQKASLVVNGRAVGSVLLQEGWGEYSVDLPEGAWRTGLNEVVVQFSQLTPVANVRTGDFAIGKTGVVAPTSIVVRSAGNEVGDFAHIFVDGVDASPNAVGYNVVVVNPQTGVVESRAAFNTFTSEEESARLAAYLQEIPDGTIVAVAVRDEASQHLTAQAVAALRSLGAKIDLRTRWRWSHAIIGIKGAAPGTALEAASETMPAQLVVGVGATEPQVAAALEWIQAGAQTPSAK